MLQNSPVRWLLPVAHFTEADTEVGEGWVASLGLTQGQAGGGAVGVSASRAEATLPQEYPAAVPYSAQPVPSRWPHQGRTDWRLAIQGWGVVHRPLGS